MCVRLESVWARHTTRQSLPIKREIPESRGVTEQKMGLDHLSLRQELLQQSEVVRVSLMSRLTDFDYNNPLFPSLSITKWKRQSSLHFLLHWVGLFTFSEAGGRLLNRGAGSILHWECWNFKQYISHVRHDIAPEWSSNRFAFNREHCVDYNDLYVTRE